MKTKRPKLPMPRRRLALLWLLAPCLVLLASYVTDAYRFTPDQVQRMEEKRRLLEPMEIIWQADAPWEQEVPALIRLTANDRAVGFSEYDFRWWYGGWGGYMSAVPRENGRPFTAGYIWQRRQLEEREVPEEMASLWEGYHTSLTEEFVYVYGCVESPEVAELVVEFEPSEFLLDPQPSQTVRLTAADWIIGTDGTAYFVCPLGPTRTARSIVCYVTAYGADGGELGTRSVTGMGHWLE